MYDVIIIGSGPAGLSAAIYAGRSELKTLVFEKLFVGGQVSTTFEVDNYPGFENTISGVDLSFAFENHSKKFGAEFKREEIQEVILDSQPKKVITKKGTYESKTIILAMGAVPKNLDVPGEAQFRSRGVSYCATCDGAFYKNKTVAVVGGGDTALEDALFLSNLAQKVYLIHRRDAFRGSRLLQNRVEAKGNVEFLLNSRVTEIKGEDAVQSMIVENLQTLSKHSYEIQGIFIAVGTVPQTELVKGKVELTEHGYISTNERMETSVPGVYAAGDIRHKQLRQIITAASDGAISAYNANIYLEEQLTEGQV